MMDLKTIRNELHKLTALVDGWEAPGRIPALERDLALEKLRTLYDAVRFADARTAADGQDPEADPSDAAPVAIDLGEVLSLDSMPEAEEDATAESASDPAGEQPGDVFAEPEPIGDTALEAFSGPEPTVEPAETTAIPGPVEEPAMEAFAGPEPTVEPALEPTAQPAEATAIPRPAVASGFAGPEVEGALAGSEPADDSAERIAEPEPEREPEAERGSEAEQESIAEPAQALVAESVAESESVAMPNPEPAAEPESAAEKTPEPTPQPAAKPQYIAPTLFGLEEETVRHRHKQRVIMSLYDTPEPAEKPARPEPARPEQARPEQATPASRPAGVNPAEKRAPTRPAPEAAEKPVAEDSAVELAPAKPTAEPASAGRMARPEPEMPQTAAAVVPEPLAPVEIPREEPEDEGDVFEEISIGSAPASGPEADSDAAHARGTEPVSAHTRGTVSDGEPASAHARTIASDAEPASAHTRGTTSVAEPAPAGAVLGEVINHDVQTLADTIAPPHDVASRLRRSEPVTDLRKAIGINDKFLMIRDLFGGDGAAYDEAIASLNGFDDLDDCMIYIAENYAWNPNSDGAKMLMELLERKFA